MRQITVSRFASFALLASALAGCGGGGGATSLAGLPATTPALAQNAGSLTTDGTTTVAPMLTSGSVSGLLSNGFTLNTGSTHGFIHVYTSSATTFAGTKPYVGESLYANGSGSWSTSIQATSVAQSSSTITTSGSVSGLLSNGFTLNTGSPHGYIHVYVNANTIKNGITPAVGMNLNVFGGGTWSTSLTAMNISQTTAVASATPAPTAVPAATATPASGPLPPNGTSTTPLMAGAKTGNGLFQVFDVWGSPRISETQAQSDANRYGIVWGARPGMAQYWRAGNASLIATYYLPLETDASPTLWGAIGHNLAWWKTNHPDWVLYSCTSSGSATAIPAMVSDLPDNIPLDIHNPAVVAYQVKLAANYAIAHNYNGLAIDEVLFYNLGGATAGTGAYGCGIYQNGTFVRRYGGKQDANWNADIVAWVKQAHAILANDATLAPYHLKLVVNHPAGSITDANEQAILANVDADLNETGYSDYGNYLQSSNLFKVTTDWTRYAQAHGVAPLTINKFSQTTALTPAQREYSIATYLMSNEGGAGLFTGNASSYGLEQYQSEYATNFGSRCGGYYGGSSYNSASPDIWYRKYSNALVVVNSGSPTRASELATLPSGHTYHDLEGRTVSNPLTVAKGDAYVLLTTNGCN